MRNHIIHFFMNIELFIKFLSEISIDMDIDGPQIKVNAWKLYQIISQKLIELAKSNFDEIILDERNPDKIMMSYLDFLRISLKILNLNDNIIENI